MCVLPKPQACPYYISIKILLDKCTRLTISRDRVRKGGVWVAVLSITKGVLRQEVYVLNTLCLCVPEVSYLVSFASFCLPYFSHL